MKKDLLYLASASPRRSELLASVGIPFRVVKQSFEEDTHPITLAEDYVIALSLGKAMSADFSEYTDARFVLGVDTIVYNKPDILGKPKDRLEAERNIWKLSGSSHEVISGVSLVDRESGKQFSAFAKTKVFFSELDVNFVQNYLDNKHYQGYAGGYAIQGIFGLVIDKIEGSYSNVVGLPLETLYQLLKQSGFSLY